MADKAKLNDMVDNIISQKAEQAQIDFHDYLQSKIGEVIGDRGKNKPDNKDKED